MEKTEMHLAQLDDLIGSIAPERLGEVDFDRLREELVRQRQVLAEHAALERDLAVLRGEYAALRQDYTDRIAGMAKAIAVVMRRGNVSRQAGSLREAVEYVQSLEGKPSAELIEHYRLTSARFREAFPTSFLHLHGRVGGEKTP